MCPVVIIVTVGHAFGTWHWSSRLFYYYCSAKLGGETGRMGTCIVRCGDITFELCLACRRISVVTVEVAFGKWFKSILDQQLHRGDGTFFTLKI